ncbi:MAG: hypothetical protein ACXVD4_12210 [Nocardioides sp.]
MTILKTMAGAGLAGLAVLGSAGQAHAVGWGTIVSSLGNAYGSYYNEGSSFARTNSTYKDNRPGGAPVYVRTMYQFYYQNCTSQGCDPGYSSGTSRSTIRTSSGSWVSSYTHDNLDPSSGRSRGVINICQDEAYAYDPCSDTTALPSFAY